MLAVITTQPGGPEVLGIAPAPIPQPGSNQVLVRVRAAALNYADMLQREGEFPAPPGESTILGVEIAGDVAACGAGVDVPTGTPVFGLAGGGGYAEFCLLDAGMTIPIPASLTYAEAAATCEGFFTADTTLFRLGNLEPGHSVLIHGGTGGIGTAAVQLAHSVGARVACTTGSEAKVSRLEFLGADLVINYKTANFASEVLAWTHQKGVDVVLDIVGAAYFERNLSVLKDGGTLVQIGIMSGAKCELDLDEIILRRLRIKGSVMRILPLAEKRAIARRFCERWLPLVATREIRPMIDSIYAYPEVAKAHERLGRSEHFGKIVLDFGMAAEAVSSRNWANPIAGGLRNETAGLQ